MPVSYPVHVRAISTACCLHFPRSVDGSRFLRWAVLGGAALYATRRIVRARRRIDFAGQVVVLTGARGLALTMARRLAREGARLALLARNADELEEARGQLGRYTEEVETIACDVGRREDVETAIERVMDRYGRVDVLINNAGVIQCGPLEHMQLDDFEQAMRVHLWGPLHAIMAVAPIMRRQGGGRIVNITSVGGKVAVPHLAPYVASKFAAVGLSDAVRSELRARGIRVTTVCPGLMRTGSHVNAMFKGNHEAELAWFSIGNAMPLLSVSAERAARQILDACRHGDPHLTVGMSTRLLIMANALFPSLMGDVLALVNRLLPGPRSASAAEKASGDVLRKGWESRSRWSPSVLTYRSDRAVAINNELRGDELRGPAPGAADA